MRCQPFPRKDMWPTASCSKGYSTTKIVSSPTKAMATTAVWTTDSIKAHTQCWRLRQSIKQDWVGPARQHVTTRTTRNHWRTLLTTKANRHTNRYLGRSIDRSIERCLDIISQREQGLTFTFEGTSSWNQHHKFDYLKSVLLEKHMFLHPIYILACANPKASTYELPYMCNCVCVAYQFFLHVFQS